MRFDPSLFVTTSRRRAHPLAVGLFVLGLAMGPMLVVLLVRWVFR